MSGMSRYTFFPGCSLATTAKENMDSLRAFLAGVDVEIDVMADWNCCGSSSAHAIRSELAFDLACRNLANAPANRPLMVACPSCYLQLKSVQAKLKTDPEAHAAAEAAWGPSAAADVPIHHFLDVLAAQPLNRSIPDGHVGLSGMRIACYYGCMQARPPVLNAGTAPKNVMEKTIALLGGEPIRWQFSSRCCGTFLTVARPDIVEPMVAQIVSGARSGGADAIVTACAMCHMNLETRSPKENPLPIFHFTELLTLALRMPVSDEWFSKHLIDPRPVLDSRGLMD